MGNLKIENRSIPLAIPSWFSDMTPHVMRAFICNHITQRKAIRYVAYVFNYYAMRQTKKKKGINSAS